MKKRSIFLWSWNFSCSKKY